MKLKIKRITFTFFMVLMFALMLYSPVNAGGGQEGTIISKGSVLLKGTFLFNCETGVVGSSGDIFWRQSTKTIRDMVPQGTAGILNLGIVDFNSINYNALKAYSYSSTPIVGNNDSTNKLVKNDVFVVKTKQGHYTKIKVLNYDYNLLIQWVTYGEPLEVPTLVSPNNDQVFYNFPRNTTLSWTPVVGATSYKIETQYYTSSGWVNLTNVNVTGNNNTSYSFNFVGDQRGRWRVTACTANSSSLPSDWWEFSYTTVAQLPTPQLVSPVENISLYNFPRTTTLTWKPSLGAAKYLVEVEYYSGGKWASCQAASVNGTFNTSYTFKFVGMQPGRWRVTAVGASPYKNSVPSEWRTFTYKN